MPAMPRPAAALQRRDLRPDLSQGGVLVGQQGLEALFQVSHGLAHSFLNGCQRVEQDHARRRVQSGGCAWRDPATPSGSGPAVP